MWKMNENKHSNVNQDFEFERIIHALKKQRNCHLEWSFFFYESLQCAKVLVWPSILTHKLDGFPHSEFDIEMTYTKGKENTF